MTIVPWLVVAVAVVAAALPFIGVHLPRWIIVILAVVAAIPFGWALGVTGAFVLAGPEVGVLPALLIPIGWIAALAFALLPLVSPAARLAIMAGGSAAFVAFGQLL